MQRRDEDPTSVVVPPADGGDSGLVDASEESGMREPADGADRAATGPTATLDGVELPSPGPAGLADSDAMRQEAIEPEQSGPIDLAFDASEES